MNFTRRNFIKTVGASGVVLASHDIIADLLAQTPAGNPLQSRFKGLADQVLAQAKAAGCTYADIRFTRSASMNINANCPSRPLLPLALMFMDAERVNRMSA